MRGRGDAAIAAAALAVSRYRPHPRGRDGALLNDPPPLLVRQPSCGIFILGRYAAFPLPFDLAVALTHLPLDLQSVLLR